MKSQEHKWDPSHSKYILLRQSKGASASGSSFSVSSSMTSNNNIAKKARGNCIGVLIRVEFGPNSLRIHTRDGLYIELKVGRILYIHTYIHTYIYNQSIRPTLTEPKPCVIDPQSFKYTYIHAYIHTYIHTYIH